MLALGLTLSQAQLVFINELHYDNSGSDAGEFVEILAPAGTDLGAYELAFYNGANGQVYRTLTLEGQVMEEGGSGFGVRSFLVSGIQNGAPDGLALYTRAQGDVLEFISYEGSFTASGGVAAGLVSTDIGVFESSSVPAGESLQRRGSGREGSDFAWAAPDTASPGSLNQGQTISGTLTPFINARATPATLSESAGDGAITLTLQLLPVPEAPVTLTLTSSQASRLPVPETVTIPTTGLLELSLSPVDNDEVDEVSTITLTLTDPSGGREPVTVTLSLLDDDRGMEPFTGTLRVATYNILNGVGAPGSTSFTAIRDTIARVSPDVIAFQETSAVGDFRNLKALLLELGFLTDRQFFATEGDGFENAAAENGQFTSDQFNVLASRFPIKRTVQIGRGVAGRRELTRYPLYVEVDVPELENDPVFVSLHLKAGRVQADQFRKRVEAYRIAEFLEAQGWDGRVDPLIVLGDFNENRESSTFHTSTFEVPPRFTDDSSLPATYRLGSDLTEAVSVFRYRTFPDSAFQTAGLRVLEAFHPNGSDNGTFIDPLNDSPLDYIMVSNAIRGNGPLYAEVLSSVLDVAFDGLPKRGLPLLPDTERRASDHRLVFADLPLTPLLDVDLVLDEGRLLEGEASSIQGRVEIGAALATDLAGTLSLSAESRATLTEAAWTIPAGSLSSADFMLQATDDDAIQADAQTTLTARIDECVAGLANVEIRNDEPSGEVILSEYREPPTGMSGRALEVYHAGTTTIDLASRPLLVYRYDLASQDRFLETMVTTGTWEPGTVIVIGDQTTRTHLESTNFLPANALSTAGGTRGTAFTTTSGELRFVLDNLGFNGDDAIEIQLGWERADVFGRPGIDPGEAWAGDGVSTQDSHLAISPLAIFGSAGFDDPSGRFFAANEETLEGFGVPPMVDDSYRAWLETGRVPLAQRGFLDDPDEDRLANLLEFALGTDPLARSIYAITVTASEIRFEERQSERFLYEVEVSQDLQEWAALDEASRSALEGGQVSWSLPEAPANYVRVRVSLR